MCFRSAGCLPPAQLAGWLPLARCLPPARQCSCLPPLPRGMVFGHASRGTRASGSLTSQQIREQASRSPGGQLWVDPEFNEDRALYQRAPADGGAPKITFNGGRPIRWLRPHELKGAVPGDIELIKDGVSSGDVIQVGRRNERRRWVVVRAA